MQWIRSVVWAALAAAVSTTAFAAGGTGGDAATGSSSTLNLSYEMYMLGLPLGHVDVSARINGASYVAQSTLDTKGLISIFWQAHIEASSNGQLSPTHVRPAQYAAVSRHGSKIQNVTVNYNGEGPFEVLSNPPYNLNKYPVTEEQRRATVDPLSAMLFVATGITASTANPCGTTAPVYDGRRRYDIQLSYQKTASVELNNHAYKGPALVCELKYVQIAGFKQKILEEGKRLPPMFAWFVSMPGRTDPSRHYLIPIKLWADTSWGTATAVISRVQLDGINVAQRN